MGPCPISDEAITSYCERNGIYRTDQVKELEYYIQYLDSLWLEHAQRKIKEDSGKNK